MELQLVRGMQPEVLSVPYGDFQGGQLQWQVGGAVCRETISSVYYARADIAAAELDLVAMVRLKKQLDRWLTARDPLSRTIDLRQYYLFRRAMDHVILMHADLGQDVLLTFLVPGASWTVLYNDRRPYDHGRRHRP